MHVIETWLVERIQDEKGAMLRFLCLVKQRVPFYGCGDISYVKFGCLSRGKKQILSQLGELSIFAKLMIVYLSHSRNKTGHKNILQISQAVF